MNEHMFYLFIFFVAYTVRSRIFRYAVECAIFSHSKMFLPDWLNERFSVWCANDWHRFWHRIHISIVAISDSFQFAIGEIRTPRIESGTQKKKNRRRNEKLIVTKCHVASSKYNGNWMKNEEWLTEKQSQWD